MDSLPRPIPDDAADATPVVPSADWEGEPPTPATPACGGREPPDSPSAPNAVAGDESGGSRPPPAAAASPEVLSLDDDEPDYGPPPPFEERPTQFLRRLLRVGSIFLILFLTLRTLAVEPFGVPTGSMAPTLIGNHREAPCPRCGFHVRVGDPGPHERSDTYARGFCPNCGKRHVDLTSARDVSGDRLLVDKNVFGLRPPRRWEVAVFRCPVDFSKPYVKRVVGLPGEAVQIADGEVYANGALLRKGLAEVRETRQPFFDMAHPPQPGGWNDRWLVEPDAGDPRLPAPKPDNRPPPAPADGTVLQGNALHLDAAGPKGVALSYRQSNVDDKTEEPVRAWNSYNGTPGRTYLAHDFVLECDLDVKSGSADGTFSARLFDGLDSVTLDLNVGPKAGGRASVVREKKGGLATVAGVGLEPGKTYHLEFGFVDRRVTVAVDGKALLPATDLEAPPGKRGEVKRPLQMGARGCHVVVRNLRLDQDIYYTPPGRNGGAVPCQLGATEYFMLGDNSGNSQDSREWELPGVPEADFIGKPFLIHQPLRVGRTTVGGRDRVFQTLDWARLRWLH